MLNQLHIFLSPNLLYAVSYQSIAHLFKLKPIICCDLSIDLQISLSYSRIYAVTYQSIAQFFKLQSITCFDLSINCTFL